MVTLKQEWSRPSTILFATECPANEKAFTVALAQAKESCVGWEERSDVPRLLRKCRSAVSVGFKTRSLRTCN